MSLPTDGGALFMTALAFLLIAATLVWLEWPRPAGAEAKAACRPPL
jgi:hypothetical protein